MNKASERNIFSDKIEKLRRHIKKEKIEGYIIPTCDAWGNSPEVSYDRRLLWLTGFSGSNGAAFVLRDTLHFYTDSRYTVQAKNELSSDWHVVSEISKVFEDLPDSVLALGYDPDLFSLRMIALYKKYAEARNIELISIKPNLIDKLWTRERKARGSAYILPEKYSGASAAEKIKQLKFESQNILISSPQSICWLLNIRGEDIEHIPVVLSYLILREDMSGRLYLDVNKVTKEVKEYLASLGIDIVDIARISRDYDEIYSSESISIDMNAPVSFRREGSIILNEDPTLRLRAVKNATEQKGFVEAHKRDGLAVSNFLLWLKCAYRDGIAMTEYSLAEKLMEFRAKYGGEEFIGSSFSTISGYRENSAIVHYNPRREDSKQIDGEGIYLVDSGGHYLFGTTDVTRTISFGEPSYEQKYRFTLVLRGHIALAMMKFPSGTTGSQLDAIARMYLWREGLDYGHGTGHGVGSFLSVHEGPHSISPRSNVPLMPGMIVSIEPGYYKEGEYGIRCENLYIIKESDHNGYLSFIPLTLVPFDENLIIRELMSCDELQWLDDYHKAVGSEIGL